MLWGLVLTYLLPDHPGTARFLDSSQRQKAIIRIASNMTSIKDEHFKIYQLFEGLMDIKLWLLFLIMVSSSLANGLASVCCPSHSDFDARLIMHPLTVPVHNYQRLWLFDRAYIFGPDDPDCLPSFICWYCNGREHVH